MHLTARGFCRNACSFVAAFFSHHWCCFHASSFDFATSIGLPLWQHIVFNNFVATAGFKSIQSICKNVRECLQENKLNVDLQDFAKDLYPVSSSVRPLWSHGWLFWELDWGAQAVFWIFPPLCRLAKNLKVDGAEGRSCYTMFYLSLIENRFSHLYLPALQLLYPVLANPNYIRKWKFGWRVMTSNAADSAFAQLVTVNGRCWARLAEVHGMNAMSLAQSIEISWEYVPIYYCIYFLNI